MRPQGNKGIALKRFSKEFAAAALFCVLTTVGCGGPSAPTANSGQQAPAPEVNADGVPTKQTILLPTPLAPADGALGMVHNGELVRVGEDLDDVLRIFPKPKGAYQFEEEPPVGHDTMKATVWEGRGQSLAVLHLPSRDNRRVVLAMYTLENVADSVVNQIVAEHDAVWQPCRDPLFTEQSTYRFWTQGPARLMIVESKDPKDRKSITVAIGHYEVMDALRMSPSLAVEDQAEALDIFLKAKKKAKP